MYIHHDMLSPSILCVSTRLLSTSVITISSAVCIYNITPPHHFIYALYFSFVFFFFKQKTAYEMPKRLEFRRVFFRSTLISGSPPDTGISSYRNAVVKG